MNVAWSDPVAWPQTLQTYGRSGTEPEGVFRGTPHAKRQLSGFDKKFQVLLRREPEGFFRGSPKRNSTFRFAHPLVPYNIKREYHVNLKVRFGPNSVQIQHCTGAPRPSGKTQYQPQVYQCPAANGERQRERCSTSSFKRVLSSDCTMMAS